ncbi:hypothetical protein DRO91_10710 [Candidatus Heimdallarchaeota archaeon]|nr:MAG: hypothetical protein DRO91_10710 [Candidatus Heimdallarchaeota archaeon]
MNAKDKIEFDQSLQNLIDQGMLTGKVDGKVQMTSKGANYVTKMAKKKRELFILFTMGYDAMRTDLDERKEELNMEHDEGQQDHICECGNEIEQFDEGDDTMECCKDCR